MACGRQRSNCRTEHAGSRVPLVLALLAVTGSTCAFSAALAPNTASLAEAVVGSEGGNGAALDAFIAVVPKAELHVHIEGTLEPEMLLELAARNGLPLPYPSVEEARKAYVFRDLQSFLDLYYDGASVLRTERDFYDLAMAYFQKASKSMVVHAEVFFDPQTHIARGLDFDVFMPALVKAAADAKAQLGLDVRYIMCFRKDLDESSALDMLRRAAPWRAHIIGVGLDSTEMGNPPSKFKVAYEQAVKEGYLPVAHAGEEGPPEYIWEALQLLHARRIDHGLHCLEDERLVAHLKATQTPLTLCPISNLKLKVYDGQLEARLMQLVRSGLCITINSDDAAYFQGYINDNFKYIARVAKLGLKDVAKLVKNSFTASFFLGPHDVADAHARIDALLASALASQHLVQEQQEQQEQRQRLSEDPRLQNLELVKAASQVMSTISV